MIILPVSVQGKELRMEALRYISLISQVGFSIVTPILLCTFIGIKLEEHFHLPFTLVFIILGVISGCVSGFKLIISAINRMRKREKAVKKEETNFVSPKRESRIFKKDNE